MGCVPSAFPTLSPNFVGFHRLLCLLCLLQRDYYYNKDGIIAYSGDALNSTKSKNCEAPCGACHRRNPAASVVRTAPMLVRCLAAGAGMVLLEGDG